MRSAARERVQIPRQDDSGHVAEQDAIFFAQPRQLLALGRREPGLALRAIRRVIRRSAFGYGNGRSKTASTTLNTAVVAPMPSASVKVAVTANIGRERQRRTLCKRSRPTPHLRRLRRGDERARWLGGGANGRGRIAHTGEALAPWIQGPGSFRRRRQHLPAKAIGGFRGISFESQRPLTVW
jgi:hypothetical protein